MRTIPSKQISTERLTLLRCDEKLLAAAIWQWAITRADHERRQPTGL